MMIKKYVILGLLSCGLTPAVFADTLFYSPEGIDADSSGHIYVTDSVSNTVDILASSGTDYSFLSSSDMALKQPSGIAIDALGNRYISNTSGNNIYKITASGVVTVFASGFKSPRGIAVDSNGTVYVADTGNNQVVKITASGVKSSLPTKYTNTLMNAYLSLPNDVAVDSKGNVYVADSSNGYVSQITSNGVTWLISGLSYPRGVAVDANGTVYACDTGNNRIIYKPVGMSASVFAGTGVSGFVNGSLATAQFSSPEKITIDSNGYLYVTDQGNHNVRRIANGMVTSFTSYDKQAYSTDNFTPTKLAFDAEGNLFAINSSNNQVLKINENGQVYVFTTQVESPTGIAVLASGNVVIASGSKDQVFQFSKDGALVADATAGSGVAGSLDGSFATAQFSGISGLTVDTTRSVIYGADTANHGVRAINPSSKTVATIASTGGFPTGLAMNSSGIYVADPFRQSIYFSTLQGNVSLFAGAQNTSGYIDGPLLSARFSEPMDIAMDPSGSLFVADTGNGAVRRISNDVVSTWAAGFANPHGVTSDKFGMIYVADTDHHCIKYIHEDKTIGTLPLWIENMIITGF